MYDRLLLRFLRLLRRQEHPLEHGQIQNIDCTVLIDICRLCVGERSGIQKVFLQHHCIKDRDCTVCIHIPGQPDICFGIDLRIHGLCPELPHGFIAVCIRMHAVITQTAGICLEPAFKIRPLNDRISVLLIKAVDHGIVCADIIAHIRIDRIRDLRQHRNLAGFQNGVDHVFRILIV